MNYCKIWELYKFPKEAALFELWKVQQQQGTTECTLWLQRHKLTGLVAFIFLSCTLKIQHHQCMHGAHTAFTPYLNDHQHNCCVYSSELENQSSISYIYILPNRHILFVNGYPSMKESTAENIVHAYRMEPTAKNFLKSIGQASKQSRAIFIRALLKTRQLGWSACRGNIFPIQLSQWLISLPM